MIFWLLYYEFFKIGLFAVGGGLAALPFLYRVSSRYPGWFDETMVTNMIAVSESTPGPIGINMATYAGFQTAGVWGSLFATIGMITPSVIIVLVVSRLLQQFRCNLHVMRAFEGLRPAVTGLVAAAAFQVMRIALIRPWSEGQPFQWWSFLEYKAVGLMVLFFFLYRRFRLSPIYLILAGAASGILLKM